jgi:hypothetical protein
MLDRLHLPISNDIPAPVHTDSSEASEMAFGSGGWTQEGAWDVLASIEETFVSLKESERNCFKALTSQ